jgi:hypothetical protein
LRRLIGVGVAACFAVTALARMPKAYPTNLARDTDSGPMKQYFSQVPQKHSARFSTGRRLRLS